MNYKPSKFNYNIETDAGDVLLTNIYSGIASLVKVKKDNKEKVFDLLNQTEVEEGDSELVKQLKDKGFLVPSDCDEDQKLKLLYTSRISDDTLCLTILPTEQCNYRCKYCYESFQRGKMSQEVQDAIVKYVKENIHRYKGLNVGWFGGEPLMALDVIENLSTQFIEICKRNRVPYMADVTSNGYLLTAETLKKLYKLKVSSYTITIDGVRETHNAQKPLANGADTFDTVINNLLDIKNTVKNKFFGITIRTNFTPQIYEHLKEYVDFFYDRFGDDDRFSFFTRPAGNWGGETVKEFEDNLFKKDAFEEVFEGLIQGEKILSYDRHIGMIQPCGSMCNLSPINSLLIDSEGNIRKCSCNLDDDETIVGNIVDGNVVLDVNKAAKWVHYYEPEGECKDCTFAPACLDNACLAKQVLYGDDGSDCQVYEKKNIGYILRLYDKTNEIEVLK